MSLDKISTERLFSNHSKEIISHWVQSLHYFHYMRARTGHNCEGDSFSAYFLYENKDDLIVKLDLLGITLTPINKDAIAFDPLASYSILDLDKIRYTIIGFDNLEQPQDVVIFGQRVHIWVQKDRFEISVSGVETDNAYQVSDGDFLICKTIEKEFDKLSWQLFKDIDIIEHPHCISKEKYPELYSQSNI